MSEAKQFDISKKAVIAAFQAVKENAGSYGVDEQTIKEFEEHLNNNRSKNSLTSIGTPLKKWS